MASRPDLGVKFKTDLIKIYLKNGGDQNHRLSSRSREPFLNVVALMDNFDGGRGFAQSGGQPYST